MPTPPTHIQLSAERRAQLSRELSTLYARTFDEELSSFRAEELIQFFLRRLGPPVYNQAIADARGFTFERLEDLDVEFFEPDAEI